MNIEKDSDSIDNLFLMSVVKKFGFGENFMTWIETVTKYQESYVINSGKRTSISTFKEVYVKGNLYLRICLFFLQKFAYLSILPLEVLLYQVKNNKLIETLKICDHHF